MNALWLNRFAGPLSFLAPAPVGVPTEEYDGWQLRYKNVVFRPALFKTEGIILAGVLFYFVAWFIGNKINSRRANAWFRAHLPFYQTQFTRPNVDGFIQDGAADFFAYSTGRRNVVSLHTTFTMLPRHDLVQGAYLLGRGLIDLTFNPNDNVELDFKLAPGPAQGFVWAVMKKDEMRTLRKDRWDLTHTKSPVDYPALPSSLGVMSEAADLTEALLKPPLLTVLNDPTALKYFRYLIVTDQPIERPEKPTPRERHVILALVPPPSSQAVDTLPLVQAVFSFVDAVDKVALKPEVTRKLKKVRTDFDEELVQESQKDKKEQEEEALEDKRVAKRKAEEERVAKLSPAEQKKWEEKERKKTMKRSQSKMVKR